MPSSIKLKDRCVIVSADMEDLVRSLVSNNPNHQGHTNVVKNEPGYVIDLDMNQDQQQRERKRPFSELQDTEEDRVAAYMTPAVISKPPPPHSDKSVTHSSTDRQRPPLGDRCKATTNPRKVAD
jgi:hypothetical protein